MSNDKECPNCAIKLDLTLNNETERHFCCSKCGFVSETIKSLGEQFIDDMNKLMKGLQGWQLKKEPVNIGKRKTTILASFRLEKNLGKMLISERQAYIALLERIVYEGLREKYCFKTSTTEYYTSKSLARVVCFMISRKKDFLSLGKGFDGHCIRMLQMAYEFQAKLQKDNNIFWFYNLSPIYYRLGYFLAHNFDPTYLFKKGEYRPKKKDKILRIPTQEQLKAFLIPSIFKNKSELKTRFNNWKKKNREHKSIHYQSPAAVFFKFFMRFKFNKTWDQKGNEWVCPPFRINAFLTVKLEANKTNIYVNGELFRQCKYLLFNILKEKTSEYDQFDSIDEIKEFYDNSHEHERVSIPPQTEFQAHCSNLQVWAENNYDTRLLHSKLSFPLLRKLVEAGDMKAKKAFKDEIAYRLESGSSPVIIFLKEGGYLDYLTIDELKSIKRINPARGRGKYILEWAIYEKQNSVWWKLGRNSY